MVVCEFQGVCSKAKGAQRGHDFQSALCFSAARSTSIFIRLLHSQNDDADELVCHDASVGIHAETNMIESENLNSFCLIKNCMHQYCSHCVSAEIPRQFSAWRRETLHGTEIRVKHWMVNKR